MYDVVVRSVGITLRTERVTATTALEAINKVEKSFKFMNVQLEKSTVQWTGLEFQAKKVIN